MKKLNIITRLERRINMKKICVVGLGYIGLPTATIFAKNGCKVIGVDIDKKIVEKLNRGEIHIKEPYLNEITEKLLHEKNIVVKQNPENANAFIIAVPTPKKIDNSCDLSYVLSAVDSVLPYIKIGDIVIIESTIPPGTTEEIIKPIIEACGFKVGEDIYLAHCPERVLPGKILEEIVNNSRIIGGCTDSCCKKVKDIYSCFVKGEIIITDSKTAEMVKLIENTFRDTNIALANELVKICNKLHINALKVIEIANKHPRVNIHQPGPGVGGHCLAVDPYFVIEKAPELSQIISSARYINSTMPNYIVSKVKEVLSGVEKPKIAVFGITYKGNIDDIRESPAIDIINMLKDEAYEIAIYDPYVNLNNIQTVTKEKAVEEADMILILTDHDEFKHIDYSYLVKKMRRTIIFDTKHIIIDRDNNSRDTKIKNLGNLYDLDKIKEVE